MAGKTFPRVPRFRSPTSSSPSLSTSHRPTSQASVLLEALARELDMGMRMRHMEAALEALKNEKDAAA